MLQLLALVTLAVGITLVFNGGSRAISVFRAMATSGELLAECEQLDDQIDSLIQESRERSESLPASLVGESHSASDLAGAFGLTLAEFSLTQPTETKKSRAKDRWRLICAGPGPSWGQFLAALDHQESGLRIESATWSCKGVTNIEIRGELFVIPATQEH